MFFTIRNPKRARSSNSSLWLLHTMPSLQTNFFSSLPLQERTERKKKKKQEKKRRLTCLSLSKTQREHAHRTQVFDCYTTWKPPLLSHSVLLLLPLSFHVHQRFHATKNLCIATPRNGALESTMSVQFQSSKERYQRLFIILPLIPWPRTQPHEPTHPKSWTKSRRIWPTSQQNHLATHQ